MWTFVYIETHKLYFLICSSSLWQDYGHSSCIFFWILVTFIFSLADNMDAVTYFVYAAFNITPTELHVIDGIPQLIFVRSSYTIEVRVDFIFMPLCLLNLLTLPIWFTEHPFFLSLFLRSGWKTVEAERISVDHVAHLKPSDGGSAATQCKYPFSFSPGPPTWPHPCFYYVFYFLFIMKPLRIIFIPL